MRQLYERKELCDVIFLVGDEKIPAHRCVLAAYSPIFQIMLYETNSDGIPDVTLTKNVEVKIRDITPATFKSFLDILYKDETEVNSQNIDGLMKVARKYHVDKVRLLCAEFMEQDINKDNAVELFLSGPTIMGDEEFGLKFIEENAAEVLKSDAITKLPADRFAIILKSDKLKAEELVVFQALVKWGEAKVKESKDPIDLKTATKDLLQYVRFPLLQINEMATIVAPSNLVEPTKLVGLFSYLSVTDEKVRSLLPNPGFETKAREGTQTRTTFTWNPQKKGSSLTLSNNNLTLTKNVNSSDWNHGLVFGTVEFKGGDQYWELKIGGRCSTQMIGVARPESFSETSIYNGNAGVFVYCHGGLYGTLGTKNGVSTSTGFTMNDTIGVHLVWDAKKSTYDFNYYKNGISQGTVFRGIPVPVVAAVEVGDSGDSLTLDSKAKKPNT